MKYLTQYREIHMVPRVDEFFRRQMRDTGIPDVQVQAD